MAKVIVIYGTPPDMEEFDRYYHDVHVPLAMKVPGVTKFEMSRGPILSPAGDPKVHMIGMLHFEDMDSLQSALASPEGKAAAADAEKLMVPGSALLIFDSEEPK